MNRIAPLLALLLTGCPEGEIVDTGPVGSPPTTVCSGPPSITPLGREVVFDASASTDPDGDELTYQWVLNTAPAGSEVELLDTDQAQARFTPTVQGDYGVFVTVVDSEGLYGDSCRASASVFDIPPPPRELDLDVGLRVELTWDNEGDDLDLHLVHPDGTVLDAENGTDCYYATCANGFGTVDWGVAGEVLDDPILVEDDVAGTGPEVTYLQEPEAGVYSVVIHDYPSDHPNQNNPSVATIEVFWDGASVFTDTRTFEQDVEDFYIWSVQIDAENQTYTAFAEQPAQPGE